MKFRVLYQTPEFFRLFGGGFGETKVTIDKLAETHREIRTLESDSLDSLYREQQAENWAKDYEATNALLKSKGLAHTSMSVGDVAENIETGEVFAVANIGFTLLNPGGLAKLLPYRVTVAGKVMAAFATLPEADSYVATLSREGATGTLAVETATAAIVAYSDNGKRRNPSDGSPMPPDLFHALVSQQCERQARLQGR